MSSAAADGPAVFIDRAERLLVWIDEVSRQIREERPFTGLDGSAFELSRVLLRGRLIPQARARLDGPAVAAFWGGTNTGKSTLINSLVGRIVSPAAGTAAFTKRLVGAGPDDLWKRFAASREGWRIAPHASIESTGADERVIHLSLPAEEGRAAPLPSSLLLIDTPDLDSSNPDCRRQAELALELADVAVWVTTGQKYKDLSGIGFLDQAMALIPCRISVFNQWLARHAEAIEDLHREYDRRWPTVERSSLTVEETGVTQDGMLPSGLVAPLGERLQGHAADIRALRSRSGRHGLQRVGAQLLEAAGKVAHRRHELDTIRRTIRDRLEEVLFQRLRALPGHDAPFELQAAIVRVLSRRLQTRVGDLVNTAIDTASGVLQSVRSRLFGSGTTPPSDPIETRDHRDLEQAREQIEAARQQIRTWIRKKGAGKEDGTSFFKRLPERFKALSLPSDKELAEQLERHFHQRSQEALRPVIERFEQDLERFCDENPNLVTALKLAVPSVSALASLAAAAVAIHSMAAMPGATEFLFAGVAIPIYRRLEGHLPAQLLQIGTLISGQPFIHEARNAFSRARRGIFEETGRWLSEPIEEMLHVPEVSPIDLELALKELERAWTTL